MRYFFLAYLFIALLVVSMFGWRGQHFAKPPLRIFPDMDEQDKLKPQKPDAFFADGHGGRLPVAQTQPRGLNPDGASMIGGIPEPEFGGQLSYYSTGRIGNQEATGMPEELKLTDESAAGLIRRGKESFGIYCAVCHGASGDGQGLMSVYGVPVATNPLAKLNAQTVETYPDGRLFNTITKGMARMSGYGDQIPLRDRWAIIAYIRTIQAAKQAQLDGL